MHKEAVVGRELLSKEVYLKKVDTVVLFSLRFFRRPDGRILASLAEIPRKEERHATRKRDAEDYPGQKS